MAKEKFNREKPHCNVGRSGMSTTEDDADGALTKVSMDKGWSKTMVSYDQVAKASEARGRRDPTKILTIATSHGVFDAEPPLRACRLPRACRLVKNMITGAAQMDGAIQWCRPPRPMPRTASTFCWRARSGAVHRVAQQGRPVDDPELWTWSSWRCGNRFEVPVPGDTAPVIRGSAIKALNGEGRVRGRACCGCMRRSTRACCCRSGRSTSRS
jgi:elongation factor Tu